MGPFRNALAVFCSAFFWLGSGPALGDHRVALVIGNSDYKNVARLANPANDAALVAEMFSHAGFDKVTIKLNLDLSGMRKALREFGASVRDADVAVIYYAGHGIELDGNNYLIPTDAVLQTDTDVLDETLSLERVLFAVEPARQLKLIILDACRDNPFARTMKRTMATRGIVRGLARTEPNSSNTMIAFAARAGSTASDGDSANSPFANALVDYLPRPGLDVRRAFGFVRDDVLRRTGNEQEPYVYGSLGGDDIALVPARPGDATPKPNLENAVRGDYELALQLGTRPGWEAFLARYPAGFYADLAKGQMNKIAGLATEKPATGRPVAATASSEDQKVASLSPTDEGLSPTDISKSVQLELRRVGCFASDADGQWSGASQRALMLFNKYARTNFDVKVASVDTLDAIKSRPTRVCPLVCDHGFKADGDQCVKIICSAGYRTNDNNECERIQVKKPKPNREQELTKRDRSATAPASDARGGGASEHEATIRAEALYAKCKQQFGVYPNSLQVHASNAGMAACIQHGGRAN